MDEEVTGRRVISLRMATTCMASTIKYYGVCPTIHLPCCLFHSPHTPSNTLYVICMVWCDWSMVRSKYSVILSCKLPCMHNNGI
ncbi:hypothetical protein EON63_22050 [archaeon]|nr:MAG: hypothetical protein EON63_22050 [archaeon]